MNGSPFTVGADFVPPNAAEIPQIAEGSGKARRTGVQYVAQPLSIPVHVEGSTVGHIRANVDRVNSFLRLAGKIDDPTYFDWRPDNLVPYETTLGQSGAYRSVEITQGTMSYGLEYGWWDHSKLIPNCSLNIIAGPMLDGERQLLAAATGGISEDVVGVLDGMSRGVRIPVGDESEGNWFTNPIFSNSTWNTGWTDGAGMDSSKNIDPEFVIFGTVSARLASTSDTTGTFTSSINVGDTDAYMLSAYVLLKTRGVVNSAVAQLHWNGSALTTTFTLIENGIYRLSAPVTGVNGAAAGGILVKSSIVLYSDGFQLEKRDFVTPLMCGDFLGHAWTSAGHGSRSIRKASFIRYPAANLTDSYICTIRVGWVPDRSTAAFTSGYVTILQSSAVAGFHLKYDAGAGYWVFMNTVIGGYSWTAGTPYVFHIVINSGTYSLYVNGALFATVDTNYLDPVSGFVYVGSDATPDNYSGGTYNDYHIFNGALAAADVLANYNDLSPTLTDKRTGSSLIYLWTKDGDNVVDYIDSGDGTYENIAVIGGVPGSVPAKIEAKMTVAGMNNADVYLGLLDVEYGKFIDPEFLTFEGSPTAVTVTSAFGALATFTIDDDEFLLLAGRRFAIMVRGDEDGANNVYLRAGVNPGGAYYYSTPESTSWIASGTSVSNDMSPELRVLDDEDFYRYIGITRAASIRVEAQRLTGSATFNFHTAQIMPFPLIRLVNISASGIAPTILYIDGKAREVNASALSYGYSVRGSKRDKFGIQPGKYNLLVSSIGAEAIATDDGDTLTYNEVYLTPRWAIL